MVGRGILAVDHDRRWSGLRDRGTAAQGHHRGHEPELQDQRARIHRGPVRRVLRRRAVPIRDVDQERRRLSRSPLPHGGVLRSRGTLGLRSRIRKRLCRSWADHATDRRCGSGDEL